MREDQELPGVVRLMTITITVVVVLAGVAGIGAAALGGSLTDLGNGFGGLWGLPALLLTLIALVLGVAAVIQIGRGLSAGSGRLRIAVLVLVGAWVVAVGYASVAHLVDPCANGWWDASSRIGSQPLCERFGSELNWHSRFYLFAHSAPTGVVLGLYLWAIRRWGVREPDTVDRHKFANVTNVSTEMTPR